MLFFGFIELPLWSALLPISAYLLYRYGMNGYNVWKSQGVPGPEPVPFLGTTFRLLRKRNFVPIDKDYQKQYGNTWGEFQGKIPILVSGDPEFIRLAMIKEFSNMPNRREIDFMDSTVNRFLTLIRDDHWKHVRSSITPAFTTGKLKKMKPLIKNSVGRLVENIRKSENSAIDIKKYCGGFTMEVIANTAFGIEVDSQSNSDSEIIQNANKILRQPQKSSMLQKLATTVRGIAIGVILLLPKILRNITFIFGFRGPFEKSAINYFKSLLNRIVDSETALSEAQGQNFLQMCLENLVEPDLSDPATKTNARGSLWTSKGLTKDDIVANAIVFFIAGYETTSTTLQYIFFELAHHPEIQQRLYEEIKTHCESENATYDELSKLAYLDCIIEETLRLYPPAPRFDREVSSPVTVQNIHLSAGSLVSASATVLHFNPDIWPNPYEFDPERFSPETKSKRHSCAWVPFGVGNRNCIGMRLALLEMKQAVVGVMWHFEVSTTPDTQARPITEFSPTFQNHPISPISLKMKGRN